MKLYGKQLLIILMCAQVVLYARQRGYNIRGIGAEGGDSSGAPNFQESEAGDWKKPVSTPKMPTQEDYAPATTLRGGKKVILKGFVSSGSKKHDDAPVNYNRLTEDEYDQLVEKYEGLQHWIDIQKMDMEKQQKEMADLQQKLQEKNKELKQRGLEAKSTKEDALVKDTKIKELQKQLNQQKVSVLGVQVGDKVKALEKRLNTLASGMEGLKKSISDKKINQKIDLLLVDVGIDPDL